MTSAPHRRDVAITGIGIASSLGEGVEAHAAALAAGGPPIVDAESFKPYPVHPLAALELDRQIPKKSDQRQMEPWQRLGVYAAGLALDSAGLKEDAEAKSALQVIVAAGGGERDHAVDSAILTGLRGVNEPGAFLNERLMSDLRPTLFLAQLSNLLAGNIGIVHGITGPSRTFMGEEQAGVDAVRTAQARIASGQCDLMLVGLLRNLFVELQRDERVQRIGLEALGIDDRRAACRQRSGMGLDALAEAGSDADTGDDHVATVDGHGAGSGVRPMASMRLCISARMSAGKGIRRKRSSASQIGLPPLVSFALVAA